MKSIRVHLFALALGLWSTSLLAAGEIRLHKIQSTESRSPNYSHAGRVEAIVDEIGREKQIALHVKRKDGTWIDVPFAYARPIGDGRELWQLNFNSDTPGLGEAADPLEFSLKYQTAGQTYWDNNGGANYRIRKNTGTVLFNSNVYDGNYRAEHNSNLNLNTYAGWVTVKNLAPVKQVKVIYSTDGWQTSKTAVGVFNPNYWYLQSVSLPNPNTHGFEEWYYSLDVGTALHVDYAIQYTVNGQIYWDNNFGRNYHVRLVR